MFPVSIIFLFTIFIFPRRDTGLHPRGHRGSPVCGHQAADDRALQRGQHSLGQHHHQVAGHLPGMIITIIITIITITFQGVEYVLIVGVGGGVPHYTDYSRSGRYSQNVF